MKNEKIIATNRKGKRKMSGWIIALIIIAVLGVGGGIGWSFLEKEHKEARNVTIDKIDFSKLKDGTYIGDYEGGMYKWRTNKVEVTVKSGKVTDIKLLSTVAEYDRTQEVYDKVIDKQSLQVDTISGATLTCKALLKGVENALDQAEK